MRHTHDAMRIRISVLAVAMLLGMSAAMPGADSGIGGATQVEGTKSGSGAGWEPLPEAVKEDLGDIRPESAGGIMSYVRVQAQVDSQYTSNAALYHSRDDADFLISPSLEADISIPLSQHFDIDVEGRVEDFTYASPRNQSLGFWGFSGNADLDYYYKPGWPRVYVGLEPYYYWSYSNGRRLTSALGPVAGVDQTYSLCRGKTLLYAGYHFGEYFSAPWIDTRQSHTVTLSVTQQLQRNLYGQLYWEFQYSDYSVYGRDETRDVLGASLIHQFTPDTFVTGFVNYANNASNNSRAKYETVNVGFSLIWQF